MSGVELRADAIVVAAGSSTRMGGADKLAASLHGRPLLAWSVEAIASTPEVDRIVVVAAADRVSDLRAAPWLPDRALVTAGGARRQESVYLGLASLLDGIDPADDRVVLVHDGARPLVTRALVSAVARAAAEHGAAIPVVPVADTIKRRAADATVSGVGDRSSLAAAQTPQAARRSLLQRAFDRFPPDGRAVFTDEAALLEACTIPVHAVDGDPENIKVTLPADLARAGSSLARLGGGPRVGLGHDRHPFGPGSPLMLGGLAFDGAPRLHGHSDGDVALHAAADALLGAAGLGDLGRLFPADARTPAGIASDELLRSVVDRLAAAGLRAASLDLTISAARPRLATRLDEMAERIAGLLGTEVGRVSVKASTANLDGMEGAGRGISAEAIAVVEAS